MLVSDPEQARSASRSEDRASSALQQAASAVGQAPQRLRDSFVGELVLAVVCVAIYVKAGTSWEGLAALAVKYHWAGSKAFEAPFARELAAHAQEIAWLLPVGLAFIAWKWNWPIGGTALVICGSSYAFLALGGLALLPVAGTPLTMWLSTGRSNYPALMNLLFTSLVLPLVFVLPMAKIF